MAYQAIYRKWRPLVFEDIVGQGHVTRALKNQIINNRISHAYLFSGTRGTGKTSAAKVFARAVNCLNNKDGSPCNECAVCKGILDGSIFDVTELDAASNNGVDDIRGIIDDVGYAAAEVKYRVYIIDEVHMLSKGAFNALLKTLEEPPPYVIFILATTEAHRIPETILSRCQRFDFKRISTADIVLRMKEITYAEGIHISDDALELTARLAEGSMRDGLSVLERITSVGGDNITLDDAVSILGIASMDTEFKMAGYVLDHDTKSILECMADIVADGADLNVFVSNLIRHFRDLLVCCITDKPGEVLDRSAEDVVRLKAQAAKSSYDEISNIIAQLSKATNDAKWVKSPRTIYELALIKAAKPQLVEGEDSLAARLSKAEATISELEKKIAEGVTVTVKAEERLAEEPKPEPKKKEKVSARLFVPIPANKKNSGNPIVIAAKKWDKISQAIFRSAPYLAAAVLKREIAVDGEGIVLLFERKEKMSKEIAAQHINKIKNQFKTLSGVDCNVKLAFRDEVEEEIIDIWALPDAPAAVKSAPPHHMADNVPAETGEVHGTVGETTDGNSSENAGDAVGKVPEEDPLEEFLNRYSDIVEVTDSSEFLDYKAEREDFVQSSLDYSNNQDDSNQDDDDDDEEEFLDESEIDSENQ